MSDAPIADAKAAARAIDALRRGWPVAIDGLALLAIESADPARLAAFDSDGVAAVLLSAGPRGDAEAGQSARRRGPGFPGDDRARTVARLRHRDGARRPAIRPRDTDERSVSGDGDAQARSRSSGAPSCAGRRPAAGILCATRRRGADVAISIDDIDTHEDATRLQIATRARLPVAAREDAEIVAFRTPEAAGEHVALMLGRPDGSPPLVRLHSECLTGDALGSLKCDCGPQLHEALDRIAGSGWGILLYLRQEGRGIGLVNKLRAYALQDQGFDTVDANTRLGFAIDARDFAVAARMLDLLGQRQVRLLTNNPAKVAGLEAAGIAVVDRVSLALPANPHNAAYLATKRDRTGHQL